MASLACVRAGHGDWPAATAARAKVWVIDDSPLQAEACRRALVHQYDVKTYDGGGQMLEDLAQGSPLTSWCSTGTCPIVGHRGGQFVRRRAISRSSHPDPHGGGSTDSLLERWLLAPTISSRSLFRARAEPRVATLARMARACTLAEVEGRLRLEAEFRERFMGMLAHDLRQP